MFLDASREAPYLVPQKVPEGYNNSYWTVAMRYDRDDISWQDFRFKYIDFGGDGIYAAWALLYQESLVTSGAWKKRCPPLYDGLSFSPCASAERVQPRIMQFVNNYGSTAEAAKQVEALRKTIRYFK
jgi:perosamine synthetase